MSEPVIFNLCCPSDALEAMCDGLEAVDAATNLAVSMRTFGEVRDGICYACAATLAAWKASGKPVTGGNELDVLRTPGGHAAFFGVPDIHQFEWVMETARLGALRPLGRFFGVKDIDRMDYWAACWKLTTDNWREQLPRIRRTVIEMREAGL